MIILDPTLAAAQDSLERNPIITINSAAFAESIPFEGRLFNSDTLSESNSDMITANSDGRVASVFVRDRRYIYLLVTNVDKTEWSEYLIFTVAYASEISTIVPAIVELLDGTFGIAIIDRPSSYRISTLIVDNAGTVISSSQTLLQTNNWIGGLSVAYTGSEYLLIYAYIDGLGQYSIQQITSSDFITWSSTSTLALTGLDLSQEIDNLTIRTLTSGEIIIVFDYIEDISGNEELLNIYGIQSMDGGGTWTAANRITQYTVYGTVGRHPSIAERETGDIVVSYQEEKDVLFMNNLTTGWCDDYNTVSGCYFNPATGKITIKTGYTGIGGKPYKSTIVVDASSWVIEACYNSTSANPIEYGSYGFQWDSYDDGKWSVVWKQNLIAVLNLETDVWRYYIAVDFEVYSIHQNIAITDMDSWVGVRIVGDILYIEGYSNYFWHPRYTMGYIDLTIEQDPITEMYDAWTHCVRWQYSAHSYQGHEPGCAIYPDVNMVIHSDTWEYYSDGFVDIFNFQGERLYHFDYISNSGFHKWGVRHPILVNNHVYGDTSYEPNYGQGARYGLIDINLETSEIIYHRPTWATIENYKLGRGKDMGDGRILFAVEPWDGGYGITIFNTITLEWTLFDPATLPGLPSTSFWYVDYDPIERVIYSAGYRGLVAFSEDGEFSQIQYKNASKDTGEWVYSESNVLMYDQNNFYSAITIDDMNVLWATATERHNGDEYSLLWDNELAEMDLSNYIVNSAVTLSWDVANTNKLTFALSDGHLFDPTNTMSIIRPFILKGRKIEISLGEIIDDINYWQQQGVFIVDTTELSYSRGKYPILNVNCEDYRVIWKQNRIVTSEYYSDQTPEHIIEDLLQTMANVELIDIDLPSIHQGHNLFHQFIDQDLDEILSEIVSHFNYFFYINMYGIYTLKRFDLTKSVDHSYSNATLIDYTPDGTYSSFVNRVIVKGEGRYEVEVLYPVEIITTTGGTVGWWGGNEVIRVWFSEDHEKQCRNAYLEILTSVSEFELFMIEGGGSEFISDTDVDDYWIEITIECPNLMAMVIATSLAVLAVGIAAMTCVVCGGYIFALSILLQVLGYMLGSIAQYSYEIYANPIGYTKQTFQATADDIPFQRQLDGLIVAEEIDDTFCYDVGRCQIVADNELAIVKAQRDRVSFKKITHLQDEIGDKIQIEHPYTGVPAEVYTTSLVRVYQKGAGVFDSIDGWIV